MTWSPGWSRVTPGPTRSTTPAPSSPSTIGTGISPQEPSAACRQLWQTPLAAMRTATSPARGSSSSTSSTVSGSRTRRSTIAFIPRLPAPLASYQTVQPPSTTILCPVTNFAPSEARNTTAAFRSSSSPTRRIGVPAMSAASSSGVTSGRLFSV